MAELSVPLIEAYAKKWLADTYCLSRNCYPQSDDGKPHFRILELYELLDYYDRILNLDVDLVITPNCPNPFDEVPENAIGTVFEDVGPRIPARRKTIQDAQKKFGDIGWKEGYINDGVSVFSKCHKEIFNPNIPLYTAWGSDDVHLGYYIHKLGFPIHQLNYKWNHMISSEPGRNESRYESYIIHYAGSGLFDEAHILNRFEQMQHDYEHFYGKH